MEITPNCSQPSRKGSTDYFTGSVRIDSPFKGSDPARVSRATVTFEPGARTAWHTHPLGQTLIVTNVFRTGDRKRRRKHLLRASFFLLTQLGHGPDARDASHNSRLSVC
jgi:hypothetical protein